jgi:hypothetical protein
MLGSVNIHLANYQITIDQNPIYGPIYTSHQFFAYTDTSKYLATNNSTKQSQVKHIDLINT